MKVKQRSSTWEDTGEIRVILPQVHDVWVYQELEKAKRIVP